MSFFEYLANNINYVLIVVLSLVIVVLASFIGSCILKIYDYKKKEIRVDGIDDAENAKKEEK